MLHQAPDQPFSHGLFLLTRDMATVYNYGTRCCNKEPSPLLLIVSRALDHDLPIKYHSYVIKQTRTPRITSCHINSVSDLVKVPILTHLATV